MTFTGFAVIQSIYFRFLCLFFCFVFFCFFLVRSFVFVFLLLFFFCFVLFFWGRVFFYIFFFKSMISTHQNGQGSCRSERPSPLRKAAGCRPSAGPRRPSYKSDFRGFSCEPSWPRRGPTPRLGAARPFGVGWRPYFLLLRGAWSRSSEELRTPFPYCCWCGKLDHSRDVSS